MDKPTYALIHYLRARYAKGHKPMEPVKPQFTHITIPKITESKKMPTVKETKQAEIRKMRDEVGRMVEYDHEIYTRHDGSQHNSFTFRNISPDFFEDVLIFGGFWVFPCAVTLMTINGHYHSFHFDEWRDTSNFIHGSRMMRQDIRMIDQSPVPYAWLQKKVPNILDEELANPEHADFKDRIKEYFKTNRWHVKVKPGDEIWKFRSEESSWGQLCGRQGYCLVRNRQIIDSFVTMLN